MTNLLDKKRVYSAELETFLKEIRNGGQMWNEVRKKLFTRFCGEGRVKLIQMFIENSQLKEYMDDFEDESGKNGLILACENGHENVVKLLIENRADLNPRDRQFKKSALIHACENQHLAIVNLLIKQGVFVDTRDKEGKTALMYACESGNKGIVESLIASDKGDDTNVDVCDFTNAMTPLMYACKGGNENIVMLLLESGRIVDINAYDKNRKTVLMQACASGRAKMVDMLVPHGADTERQDGNGNTALMYAIDNGHKNIIESMVKTHGADVHVNEAGRTGQQSSNDMPDVKRGSQGYSIHLLLRYCDVEPSGDHGRIGHTNVNYKNSVWRKLKCLGISTLDGSFDDRLKEMDVGMPASAERNFDKLLKEHTFRVPTKIKTPNGSTIYRGLDFGTIGICLETLIGTGVQIHVSYAHAKTALIHACERNDKAMVDTLIEYGVNVNGSGFEGKTALLCCTERGYTNIADLLLKKGADVHAEAIANACQTGEKSLVETLLKNGANLLDPDSRGFTPLMHACASGSVGLVQFLINQGSNIHAEDESGETAFDHGCKNGHTEVAEYLLKNGVELDRPNRAEGSVLMKVCDQEKEHPKMVQLLLKHGKEFGETFLDTLFSLACKRGHGVIAGILLNQGARFHVNDENVRDGYKSFCQRGLHDLVQSMLSPSSIRTFSKYPSLERLPLSCEYEDAGIVQLMLEKGIAVDENGGRALGLACASGWESVAGLLIKHGANVNATGYEQKTPLMLASRNGHLNIVELLVKNGADVDAAGKAGGKTSIHFACEYGHEEIVKFLIENGATVVTGEQATQVPTPLMYACMGGHDDLALLLINNGAKVVTGANGKRQYPAFAFTAKNGNKKLFELLIKHGWDIDGREDSHLETVQLFHSAAGSGQEEIVKVLIRYNAYLLDSRYTFSTPLMRACGNGHELVANTLIKYGADIDYEYNSELLEACRYSHDVVINLLVKQEVDLNKQGYETALSAACESNPSTSPEQKIKTLKLLANLGLDLNCTDGKGNTGLVSVIKNDNFPVFLFLINAGVLIDTQNATGTTPVMQAALCKDTVYLKVLMEKEANLDLVNDAGHTVFAYALEGNGTSLYVLLHTADIFTDPERKKLKPLHTKALGKTCRPSFEALRVAMEYGVFDWSWCTNVSSKSINLAAKEYGYKTDRCCCCCCSIY